MIQFTDLHLAISSKLGWGDILAKIALPAIQQILENAAEQCSAQIEEPVGYELLEDDILAMSSDALFTLLYSPKYLSEEEQHMLLSLRGEIEDYIRRGYDYKSAIAEWFK